MLGVVQRGSDNAENVRRTWSASGGMSGCWSVCALIELIDEGRGGEIGGCCAAGGELGVGGHVMWRVVTFVWFCVSACMSLPERRGDAGQSMRSIGHRHTG